MKLSVITPFCNEFPQVLFTIKSIAEELVNRVDFEIIAVDNYANGYVDREEDKSGEAVKAGAGRQPWLKYIQYKDKLSHWNAKRVGVAESTGDVLLFCDAHTVPSQGSISKMFEYYCKHWEELDGSLHLPLTYKILESDLLIYKFLFDKGAFYDYRFTGFRPAEEPYEVPCMSTCGMMMHREVYQHTGGWYKEFGIYGGGEHYMNYTMAVLGLKKWIWPHGHLAHHGEKRGYSSNYDDTVRNRFLAHYFFGGVEVLKKLRAITKGKDKVLDDIMENVMKVGHKHRELIRSRQLITIEDWMEKSKESGLIPK